MAINRHNIQEFYEKEIEKIEDDQLRNKLYEKTWELYDIAYDIEEGIKNYMEEQNSLKEPSSADLADEFNYANCYPY